MSIRITGGEFRGRAIQTLGGLEVRPTQAKLRQALFNSIQSHLVDSCVLDLFSGTGALGFEALSRGSKKVVFVEKNERVVQLLKRNCNDLQVWDRVALLRGDVKFLWKKILAHAPFDIVIADPPYRAHWENYLLTEVPWEDFLREGGLICLEWTSKRIGSKKMEVEVDSTEPLFSNKVLTMVREKSYGDSILTTFLRSQK